MITRPSGRRLAIERLETRDLLALSIQMSGSTLVEGQTAVASVIRSGVSLTQPLTVYLASTDVRVVNFATPSVVIPANAASANFTVISFADGVVSENRQATIAAAATTEPVVTKALTIVNAEVLPLGPGVTNDNVVATPSDVAGRYAITPATGPLPVGSIVDLSQDLPGDQRTALLLGTGSPYLASTTLIRVDPVLQYVVAANGRFSSVNVDSRPIAFTALDSDRLTIEPVHVGRYLTAVDTTLARAVHAGDTAIYVTDASGWSNDPWETGASRALAWYGYRNAGGELYADYTYTRNVATGGETGLWAAGGIAYDAAVGAYRIPLLAPWSGPALADGAAVRNAQGGDVQSYPTTTSTALDPLTFVATYAATFGGGVWQQGLRNDDAFPPATAYLRPAVHQQAKWNGVQIASPTDAALGLLNFTPLVAGVNSQSQVPLVFDVLAKNVFGAGATATILSIGTPQHGSASIVPGPAGRNVVQYVSAPGYEGTDVVSYTLRNSATLATFSGQIHVTIATDEALRLQKLREIGLGMLNYESSKKIFPLAATATNFDASGNPYLSWRVHILPYLGFNTLYQQFHLNEPWNSAHNLPLAAQMPTIFRDPDAAVDATTTRFRIISGEGDEYYWRRSNNLLVGPTFSRFRDGLSNSLLVVETGASAAIPWTQPDLPNFDPASPLAALGALNGQPIRGVLADASTITLPATISPATFASLVTIDGGEILNAGTLKRQYAESQGPAALAAYDAATIATNMRYIALAMLNYESSNHVFPIKSTAAYFDANGNPFLSWRVHILPFIEMGDLYAQFHLDEPWDSQNNLPLASQMPDVFRSAGDSASSATTRYVTFTGPAAPFGFAAAGQRQAGPTFASIRDEPNNTIMFVEAGPDAAVPWTKPADAPLNVADPYATLGTLPGGQLRFTLFDGSVNTLPAGTPASVLAAMATRDGNEAVDPGRYVKSSLAPRAAEENQLKTIALGMLNFESARQRLPANKFAADGTPLLSWRVLLLPYMGYDNLYAQFHLNEPWDSPHNLSLLPLMPTLFRSQFDPVDTTLTHVMTFVGPGAPFPATGTSSTTGPRLRDIFDGTSNTFAFIEAGDDVLVPWTKPTDLPYYAANPYSALGDLGVEMLPAFMDGSVKPQPTTTSISALAAFITHNGGTSSDTPPAVHYIRQSHGDARLREAGADWFDVVFDAPPTTPQTLALAVSDPAVAVLDKQQLVFNATNWNIPQRVIIRGVDNFADGENQSITVTVGSQSFAAVVVDDDLPPPDADLDADGAVDGGDFLSWQRAYGTTAATGDADKSGAVDGADLAVWNVQFGAQQPPAAAIALAAPPLASPVAALDAALADGAVASVAQLGAPTSSLNASPSTIPATRDSGVTSRESAVVRAANEWRIARATNPSRPAATHDDDAPPSLAERPAAPSRDAAFAALASRPFAGRAARRELGEACAASLRHFLG